MNGCRTAMRTSGSITPELRSCGCTGGSPVARSAKATADRQSSSCCQRDSKSEGSCTLASACEGTPSLAMVYSPYQAFGSLYDTDEALWRGTLFTELDKPWYPGGAKC